MSPAKLAVRNPIFILSVVILMLVLGMISLKNLPFDLFAKEGLSPAKHTSVWASSRTENLKLH
jgi:hypothetical protein